MKEENYKSLFKLIDLSNRPNGTPGKELAEQTLIEVGIYNSDGELVTKDQKVIDYYESKWC